MLSSTARAQRAQQGVVRKGTCVTTDGSRGQRPMDLRALLHDKFTALLRYICSTGHFEVFDSQHQFPFSSSSLLSVLALGLTVILRVYSCLDLGPETGRLSVATIYIYVDSQLQSWKQIHCNSKFQLCRIFLPEDPAKVKLCGSFSSSEVVNSLNPPLDLEHFDWKGGTCNLV